MALEDFIDRWEKFENVTKAVVGMDKGESDDVVFSEHYSDLRKQTSTFNPLFQDYDATSQDSRLQKGVILGNAKAYQRGLGDASISYSDRTLESILDDAKNKLGENLIAFIASIEPRIDAPKKFADLVKAYREAMKPLSKENPEPEKVKREMVKLIDRIIGDNPDEETRIIADAIKRLYDSPDFAEASYAINIVKPRMETLKTAVNANDNWKVYMRQNIPELKKEDRLMFYLSLYSKCKD